MKIVRDFGRFWWDFVVGDEWRIAVIVAAAAALGALAASGGRVNGELVACGVAVVVMAAVCAIVIAHGRRSQS